VHTIWMCGMCQSGKSTLAEAIEKLIKEDGKSLEVLDGDAIRAWAPTGFDEKSINDHLRRVALMCYYLNRHGIYAIVPVISPLSKLRDACREIIGKERFSLVFVDTPAQICAKLDTKGIWADAQALAIANGSGSMNLAGYDAVFEKPNLSDSYVIHTPWPRNTEISAFKIWEKVQSHRSRPSAIYVGRWQPFHNGHRYIIDQALAKNERVVVAIRETPQDASNPYSLAQVKEMIQAVYRNNVEIMSIPDICSINIGRNVGYDVNEIQVPEDVKGILATKIREYLSSGSDEWEQYVPKEIYKILR